MLGRFSAAPPLYRHALADSTPLVSGVETTMAWLDALAVRHEWVTDFAGNDLIGPNGFNWYRYTGGNEEKELFTPKTTHPFNLTGYPHNISGFWENFKDVEEFVGDRLGHDWTNKRWDSTYNGNLTWKEDNVLPDGTTNGDQSLFSSGIKFGKWFSKGFNSFVHDGTADDPDYVTYINSFTKIRDFGLQVPWNITITGPNLFYDDDDDIFLTTLGIPSGWAQGWSYPSSGDINGAVLDFSNLINITLSGNQTTSPNPPQYQNWSLSAATFQPYTSKSVMLNSDIRETVIDNYSGLLRATPGAPYQLAFDAVAGTLDRNVPDEEYLQYRPAELKFQVNLNQVCAWTVFDLSYLNGESLANFPLGGVTYYNFRKLHGLRSVGNFPVKAFLGQNQIQFLTGAYNRGNQNNYTTWTSGVRSFHENDYDSTHKLGYKWLQDRRILTSGNPASPVYNLVEPGGLLLNDATFLGSGFINGDFTDIGEFYVPSVEYSGKSFAPPAGLGTRIPASSVNMPSINTLISDNVNDLGDFKRKLCILLYTKDEYLYPAEFPASGTLADVPQQDTTATITYYWSGIRPADGDPYYYATSHGGQGLWPPQHQQLVNAASGILTWNPMGSIPLPGATSANFLNKNALTEAGGVPDLTPYIIEFRNRCPVESGIYDGKLILSIDYDNVDPTYDVYGSPNVVFNRSFVPTVNIGGEVDTLSEYDWRMSLSNVGLSVGIDGATLLQPSGAAAYGFYV